MSNDKGKLSVYLDEIGHETLLSAEEEKALAERISKGDGKALERLTTANLKYVVSVAKQYKGNGLEIDDLVAEGNIGLMKAAGRYKSTSTKRFAPFSAPYIREAIERAIEEQAGLYKLPKDADTPAERKVRRPLSADAPLGTKTGVNLLSVLSDPNFPVPDTELSRKTEIDTLKEKLGVLDERSKEIISYIYGIDMPHLTMAEIGQKMGLKRERVRQIRDKAIRKLRKNGAQ